MRSLQSEEYQFCNDIQNLKVSSSVKPISIKSFNNVKNVDENEDMPTSKMIHYNVKKKKTSF